MPEQTIVEVNITDLVETDGEVVVMESVAVEVVEVAVLYGYSGAADKYYEHIQYSASSTWNVSHQLGKMPAITVVDSSNNVVHGDVEYTNTDNAVLTFSAPFAGRAHCS